MTSEASPPRLCHIRKRENFDGYGFTLYSEKGMEGQLIGSIDARSPAEMAGLKKDDRIVEVNGVNVLHESHKQVVARVKGVEYETRFLVVDQDSWKIYKQEGIQVDKNMPNLISLYSEPEDQFEHLAKMCHLKQWDGFVGYGFNLQYDNELEKHTIGKIDDDSPARITGMVEGDYIMEVNGVNVERTAHKDVVEMITEKTDSVDLLLVGPLENEMFMKKDIKVGGWMAQLRHLHCPALNPTGLQAEYEAKQTIQQTIQQHRNSTQINEEGAVKAVEMSVNPHRLRLAHLRSWGDGGGYGFNMQSEKKKEGQFISNVDTNSPADLGGLKEGDMILAVNNTSVKDLKHQDVVSLIRTNPSDASLLLVDMESKNHFESIGLAVHDQEQMQIYVDTITVPESKPAAVSSLPGSDNKENMKNEKSELLLDVNKIQSSNIYNLEKQNEDISSAGTGEVPVSNKHVPSPTAVVGDVIIAGSAQEARQRLAKKKQASQQISVQDRYEVYKKL